MTITEFYIRFDEPVYHPGQMITGHVFVSLDKPKEIRGVELKIRGRTKFKWVSILTELENSTVSAGKENHLKYEQQLEGEIQLAFGVHKYFFNVLLPPSAPSTFKGMFGEIAYYGEAKVDIPSGIDKTTKKFFAVENWLDLNLYPQLKTYTQYLCGIRPPLHLLSGFSVPLLQETDENYIECPS